jgi:hypothetical protein
MLQDAVSTGQGRNIIHRSKPILDSMKKEAGNMVLTLRDLQKAQADYYKSII